MSNKNSYKNRCVEEFCLKNGYDFISCDLFGHGESSGDVKTLTMSKCLDMASQIVENICDDIPYVVVGSSMGGWLSFLLGNKYKQRFKAIVGVAPAVDFTDFVYNDYFDDGQRYKISQNGLLYTPSNNPDVCYVWNKEMFVDGKNHEFLNKTFEYPNKITILMGDKDKQVPLKIAFMIKDAVSSDDVDILISKGADHGFNRKKDIDLLTNEIEKNIKLILC